VAHTGSAGDGQSRSKEIAVRCSLISDDIILSRSADDAFLSREVDDTLPGHLSDLSLAEAADGAKFINAGGEELFWRYGAFSQPYGFVRLICCRARKTVRSPALHRPIQSTAAKPR